MNTIDALLQALENSEDYRIETLERILEQNLPLREEIMAISAFELPYGRSMIALNDRYEVIVGCWPKGGWCDVHDHGTAIGIVYAYSGEIEHFRYEMHDGILDLLERATMKAHECVRLESGMIHSLQNISSEEPYVGLHIYSPPTSDVRVFDLKTGDIYHVTDDYPALIPKESENIVKHEKDKFVFRNSVHSKVTNA
ncbi:MAG: cysteine dioxygenase family protein [Bacteroidota bacterium]|nr:cysteine dioxygenase family protein [Bacteroidota bacterium]MDP4229123.1 cysteine dioxygenase family protein [Bacteroidota bacterium]MDP4235609.1 cysteine dioxygenase family protein [Bacteroidota bacterium]